MRTINYKQLVLPAVGRVRELIDPVLLALLNVARASADNRRALRAKVLPPLTNVSERPEVSGEKLREDLF